MRKVIPNVLIAVLAAVIVSLGVRAQLSNANNGIPVKTVLQSVYTNATTTFSDVTGLSLSVSANTSYVGQCYVLFNGSAATAGPKFQWTGPMSAIGLATSMYSDVLLTTSLSSHATGFSAPLANSGVIAFGNNEMALIFVGLSNGVNAGTMQLQAAANGLGTLTIQPGSYCVFQ